MNWPGSDAAILVLIAIFLAFTALGIRFMRGLLPGASTASSHALEVAEQHQ